jgi:ubiquinone biosynthesis protein
MIGFIEGAILHGIFHGDLHGGNLFVMPDGRTALLDFGITGRLDETKRLAFLRLLMGGSANDVMGQLAALRDLGALPADADLDLVFRELRLDGPVVDPTTMTGDQLVAELQQVIKALLGLGARMPKELMLFVKNMVFVDSAIATLAPDLDLFGEIAELSLYFATRHGDRIMADVGIDPRTVELDLDGFKASFGVDPATEQLTHRELQARRETIRRNLAERPRSRPGPRPRRR